MRRAMSFLGSIGMRTWVDQGAAVGELPVETWMRGPGGGLRIGIAAILADVVIGIPPTGQTAGTIELSVRWTAGAPAIGPVTSPARVLKWGRRLMFGDAPLEDATGAVVGWAAATFLTQEV